MILTIDKALLVILVIFGLILIYLLLLFLFVLVVDKKYFNKRLSDNLIIKCEEFKNINKEEFSFISDGTIIKGYVLYKEKTNDKVLIFSPGFSSSSERYVSEINMFTDMGYKVLIYDYAGSFKSDGKKFKGAPQTIKDLNNCINYVKEKYNNPNIVLVGHSIGAYATVNVLKFNNVDKAIAIAPFNNIMDVIKDKMYQKFGKNIILFIPIYKILYYIKFKKYSLLKTYDTLKYVNDKVLLIQGTEDKMVSPDAFYQFASVNMNFNVTPLLLEGKKHYPLLSFDALTYKVLLDHQIQGLKIKYGKNIPQKEIDLFNESIDHKLRNKLDEGVINSIKDFLKEV